MDLAGKAAIEGRPGEIAHLSVFVAKNDYRNSESIRLDGAIRMQAR